MCGVFGFASPDHGPDMKVLERIATVTMRRGAHAWGMAWVDKLGRMRMFKQTGRIVDNLGMLALAKDARYLIGHCRFATQGSPENNLNNHPHPADGGWIVHNGVIRDYHRVILTHDLYPTTSCDSEVLGLLIEQTKGKIRDRCVEAVLSVDKAALVMLGIWKPGRIVAVRQGNPLHQGKTQNAEFYLASLRKGLPGKVTEIPDETIVEYTAKGARRESL